MGLRLKLTKEEVERELNKGKTVKDVALYFGCSETAIYNRMPEKRLSHKICKACHQPFVGTKGQALCNRKDCREKRQREYYKKRYLSADEKPINTNPYTDTTYLLLAQWLDEGRTIGWISRETGRTRSSLKWHVAHDKEMIETKRQDMKDFEAQEKDLIATRMYHQPDEIAYIMNGRCESI